MLLLSDLSDEMEIVEEVVIDELSELDVGKVGEEGDRFVEELLLLLLLILLLVAIIIESSGSMMIFFFLLLFFYFFITVVLS
jgi:hypothetical protein